MSESIYLNEIIRLSIGMLLVMAAFTKTKDLSQFKDTLVTSFHLSESISRIFAPILVMAEWGTGIILLSNAGFVDWAMKAALVMFLMFTSVVSYMLYRDGVVKCNCFGEQQRPVSVFDMVRNTVCILAIVFYLTTAKSTVPLPLESTLLLFGVALSLTFIVVSFHEVVSILRKSV